MSETIITLDGYAFQKRGNAWYDLSGDVEPRFSEVPHSSLFADALDVIAAARREVETAQQRCEWVATALHGDPMFGPGCDEPLVQQVRALQADLGTSRAALEDVRRVEKFWAGNVNDVRCEWVDATGERVLFIADRGVDCVASADSLAALGAALAQEAGDAK